MWFKELRALEKSKGIRDPRLDEAIPPEETEHIFYLYWHRFREAGITHQEIRAYEELEEIKLEPWEIDLLFAIHSTAESTIAEITKAQRKKK